MNENLKKARSYYYEFLAIPFFFYEKDTRFNIWKKQLDYLEHSVIRDDDIKHFKALKEFDFKKFKDEQNEVLFSFSYSNVPMTASFYMEGRDDGKARMLVLNTLRKTKYRKNDNLCKDSEDFIGFIFYMMSTLLKDEFKKPNFLSTELFTNVINNFVDEFASMLIEHEKSNFFMHLSAIMKSFFTLERSVLGLQAPKIEKSFAKEAISKAPYNSMLDDSWQKYRWDENS